MRNVPLSLVILLACATGVPARAATTLDLGLQLEREEAMLQQLHERLKLIEAQTQTLSNAQRGNAPLAVPQPAEGVPDRLAVENLTIERAAAGGRNLYSICARHVPAIQVLEGLAKLSGLALDIHPEVDRDTMTGRIWMEIRNAELFEALEVLSGMQAVGIAADAKGIILAPPTALSDRPIDAQLRLSAAEAYQAALVKYPASARAPEAYMGIARYYEGEGFHDAAIQAAQRVLDRYPRSAALGPALMLLGRCHDTLGQFDKARAAYHRYIDNHPGAKDLPAVHHRIGDTWMRETKWTQALPVFESVAREWPDREEGMQARMRLAECLMQLAQFDRALEQLRLIEERVEQFPRRDELKFVLAQCYMQLKRAGPARLCLQEVVRTSTDSALAERAYYSLGDTFLSESQFLPAIESYRSAMTTFPTGRMRRAAPLRMCRAYLGVNLFIEAEKELQKLPDDIYASPETREVILALAEWHLSMGNPNWVLAALRDGRWTHDTETEPELLVLQGRALLALGAHDQAADRAATAARLAQLPAHRNAACALLGECHAARNDALRAAMAFGGKVE